MYCILITGIPAAGKTTIAVEIAEIDGNDSVKIYEGN